MTELEQLLEDQIGDGLDNIKLYDWQKRFISATASNRQCLLMAANRCVGANTPIQYYEGTVLKSALISEFASYSGKNVRCMAGKEQHRAGNVRAYFQGILPTFRLFLSNGQYLDCSGEHKLLTSEGCYTSFLSLMLHAGAQSYFEISEDFPANCGAGDCLCGQPLHLAKDSDLKHTPLSFYVQQHIRRVPLLEDAAAQIDLYSQASLYADLLSSSGGQNHAEALNDKFSSLLVLPSDQQMSCLHQASQQLLAGSLVLPQADDVVYLNKLLCYGEACSNRIFFPLDRPLLSDGVSIIAWHQIGLQPCFDLQVPNYHNYYTSGVNSHNCGKTYTGCYIDAVHATGRYPDWWDGYRFDHAPLIWCLGYSGDKCRDLLQMALFGAYSSGIFSGGLIAPDQILDAVGGAIPRLAQQVNVRWVGPNGEEDTTVLQFKSYSQGQHALMGDGIDWYHIDEEPKDVNIWPQVLTRTASGDNGKGGRGILTFTPENGKTELVSKFMDDPSKGQYLQTATWDDAPHLSEDVKEEILAAYPPYQRAMRSQGLPLMGAGLIYAVSEDDIKCEPFEIPDYWFVINGMDFGWDHPQAHVQLVWDRDADIFYLVNAFKKSKIQPFEAWHVVKPWAENCPTAWPHDGLQHEKGSAKQQKDYYEEEGFCMLPEHATWEDGGNGVWAGIMELNNLMKSGRFKVVSSLVEWFEEMRQYHTKTTASGKSEIVKTKDDLLDAARYAYMMRRYAIRVCDLYPDAYMNQTNRSTGRDGLTGY